MKGLHQVGGSPSTFTRCSLKMHVWVTRMLCCLFIWGLAFSLLIYNLLSSNQDVIKESLAEGNVQNTTRTIFPSSKGVDQQVHCHARFINRSWTFPQEGTKQSFVLKQVLEKVHKQENDLLELQHMDEVHRERMSLLERVCGHPALQNLNHMPVGAFTLNRIFVCKRRRVLFCQTPKVGNTQWKKVLLVANGLYNNTADIPEEIVHQHEKNGLPRLSNFSAGEISHMLASYFKFFIVRDPFDRIISAFKDKFVENPRHEVWYQQRIAPVIIQKFRRGKSSLGPLRFEEFVRYLGSEKRSALDSMLGEHIIHWESYLRLCAPCSIRYDSIGHHETLRDDAPYILHMAGLSGLVRYPDIPRGITEYNRSKIAHYFATVDKKHILKLYLKYWEDFALFGYKQPEFLLR
uniref:carbohydrate sulfotransferase 10 isoform X2 n=1 Tax=Myxine glutinosa TaxID=7769 RepID=UPI00358F00BF